LYSKLARFGKFREEVALAASPESRAASKQNLISIQYELAS